MPEQAEIDWWKRQGFSEWKDLSDEQRKEAREQLGLKETDKQLSIPLWRFYQGKWEMADIDHVKKVMGTFLGRGLAL